MLSLKQNLLSTTLAIGLLVLFFGTAWGQTFNFSTLAGNAGYGDADGPTNQARFNGPEGIATDTAGNLYVADTQNSDVRRIDPNGLVTTLAGVGEVKGNVDGVGGTAEFKYPRGIAVDDSGNVYIADTANFTIREISPTNDNWVVTTLAGTPGIMGNTNGVGSHALFNLPSGIAEFGGTNLFVTDTDNSTVRMLSLSGTNWVVTTLAGAAGTNGFLNGTNTKSMFNQPAGIAVDANRKLYIADTGNAAIRELFSIGTNWITTTIASNLNSPNNLSIDPAGALYVTLGDNTVRKLALSGGNWVLSTISGISGMAGSIDGSNGVLFNDPHGVVIAADKSIFVADTLNNTVRKIATNGVVSTCAGLAGGPGTNNGVGPAARFDEPLGLAVDGNGTVFVADSENNTIREITSTGVVTAMAGMPGEFPSSDDGVGTNASFNLPAAVAVDTQDNVYVADSLNNEIRELNFAGGGWSVTTLAGHANARYMGLITSVVAGVTYQTNAYYYESNYVNYSGAYTNLVNGTSDVVIVPFSNNPIIFVTNVVNGSMNVFKVTLSSNVFELAPAPPILNGQLPNVLLNRPTGLGLDGAHNLYVADGGTNGVQVISADGEASTLPGSTGFYSISSTNQLFYECSAVAVDMAGDVFVADAGNNTIREITAGGAVTTIAGSPGFYGDADGTNSAARLAAPSTLAVDAQTNLYVLDAVNSTVRRISPVGTNWVVTTIGGQAGMRGSTDGLGTAALFNQPGGIAVGANGNLYISDTGNNTVRLGVGVIPNVNLQIQQAGGQTVISWPAEAAGFILESSTNLIDWTAVTNVTGQELVISNRAPASMFFRLHQP